MSGPVAPHIVVSWTDTTREPLVVWTRESNIREMVEEGGIWDGAKSFFQVKKDEMPGSGAWQS